MCKMQCQLSSGITLPDWAFLSGNCKDTKDNSKSKVTDKDGSKGGRGVSDVSWSWNTRYTLALTNELDFHAIKCKQNM